MSGLFGAKSPSASWNLFKSSTEKGKKLPAGVVSQTALPAGPPRARPRTPMTPPKHRVDYG